MMSKAKFEEETRPSAWDILKNTWQYSAQALFARELPENYQFNDNNRRELHFRAKPHVQAVNYGCDLGNVPLGDKQKDLLLEQIEMEEQHKHVADPWQRARFQLEDIKKEMDIARSFKTEGHSLPDEHYKEGYTAEDVEKCKKLRASNYAGSLCHTLFGAAKNAVKRPNPFANDFSDDDELFECVLNDSSKPCR